jgi:hypothetical protein
VADNLYQAGDVVPLQATFTNAAGTPTNTTVVLEVRKPDGTLLTPTPTNASTGVYTYNQATAVGEEGVWWYAFIGSGAVAATEQNSFVVEARRTQTSPLSTSALLNLAEARDYVLGSPTEDSRDHKLIPAINEISAAVAAYTRREWLPVTTNATRTFFYRGGGLLSLVDKDLRSVTAIVAYTDYPTAYQTTLSPGTSTVVADYRLGPSGGMPPNATYRWIEFSNMWRWATYVPAFFNGFQMQITGNWGIGVVPDDVKLAVKIALRDNSENPEGFATRTLGPMQISEPVDELVAEARWRALPAESRALLTPYRDDPVVIAA